jgi:hypothetical protein
MRKVGLVIVILVFVVAVVIVAFLYNYRYSKHVIFSAVKDDLVFRVYCKGRHPMVFATYVEISSRDGTVFSLSEIPPSSDDLADCGARFPIADVEPNPTYSCLTISFLDNERPPVVMPLPLVDGLDLPFKVRPKLAKRGSCGCGESGPH